MPDSANLETLEYAAPQTLGSRPKWVYAVAGAYLLLLLGFISVPAIGALSSGGGFDADLFVKAGAIVAVFLLSAGLLILVPVRARRDRRIARRAIWFPLIGAAILFAVLCFAAGLATLELMHPHWAFESLRIIVFVSVGLVWLVWLVVFWLASRSLDPLSLSARLYKTVIGGSVAELLIAVPMHLVVRRRTECCAGYMTGSAICLGAATALVAFGPGLFFLYHRRWIVAYRERSSVQL